MGDPAICLCYLRSERFILLFLTCYTGLQRAGAHQPVRKQDGDRDPDIHIIPPTAPVRGAPADGR